MACPYFIPDKRCDAELWPHRARLPLGDGFRGHCVAHAGEAYAPSEREVGDFCNLGYAGGCDRLPPGREADAIRFAAAREQDGILKVQYVFELAHAPGERGTLEYELANSTWRSAHADIRVQSKAQCYLESYLARRNGMPADGPK